MIVNDIHIKDDEKFMNNDKDHKVNLILLADDDADDCMFFAKALEEIDLPIKLVTVNDGEALMKWLKAAEKLPDIVFLDMNMPCKNGAECLAEIREIERLKNIPVVIISTSLEDTLIKSLHESGAQWYIKKPNLFTDLKILVAEVIEMVKKANYSLSKPEKFVLTVENNK